MVVLFSDIFWLMFMFASVWCLYIHVLSNVCSCSLSVTLVNECYYVPLSLLLMWYCFVRIHASCHMLCWFHWHYVECCFVSNWHILIVHFVKPCQFNWFIVLVSASVGHLLFLCLRFSCCSQLFIVIHCAVDCRTGAEPLSGAEDVWPVPGSWSSVWLVQTGGELIV